MYSVGPDKALDSVGSSLAKCLDLLKGRNVKKRRDEFSKVPLQWRNKLKSEPGDIEDKILDPGVYDQYNRLDNIDSRERGKVLRGARTKAPKDKSPEGQKPRDFVS